MIESPKIRTNRYRSLSEEPTVSAGLQSGSRDRSVERENARTLLLASHIAPPEHGLTKLGKLTSVLALAKTLGEQTKPSDKKRALKALASYIEKHKVTEIHYKLEDVMKTLGKYVDKYGSNAWPIKRTKGMAKYNRLIAAQVLYIQSLLNPMVQKIEEEATPRTPYWLTGTSKDPTETSSSPAYSAPPLREKKDRTDETSSSDESSAASSQSSQSSVSNSADSAEVRRMVQHAVAQGYMDGVKLRFFGQFPDTKDQ